MKTPLILALGLLLSGCAPQQRMGRFINLETGEEIRVEAVGSSQEAVLLKGTLPDGRKVSGELWEVRAFDTPTGGSEIAPHPTVDTVFYGTGILRDGECILEFKYHRHKESWNAVGTATDNRGARYKVVFWKARKPEAVHLSGP
jgi:hypothetical protein